MDLKIIMKVLRSDKYTKAPATKSLAKKSSSEKKYASYFLHLQVVKHSQINQITRKIFLIRKDT